MTPNQITDTMDQIKEAQHKVCVHLQVYLRRFEDAALAILAEARKAESNLFKIVLASPDDRPSGFQKGHVDFRKRAQGEVDQP